MLCISPVPGAQALGALVSARARESHDQNFLYTHIATQNVVTRHPKPRSPEIFFDILHLHPVVSAQFDLENGFNDDLTRGLRTKARQIRNAFYSSDAWVKPLRFMCHRGRDRGVEG